MRWVTVILLALSLCGVCVGQTKERKQVAAVVSAQIKNGKVTYKLDGKVVEDSVRNSLITNLGKVLTSRGKETPVFIVADVRAPFALFGKIDTALDKVDLSNRRYFVSDFKSGMMREIHWADESIPIPRK